MSDEKRLRELAEAATQPSPWTVREDIRGADERRCMVLDCDDMWVADCGNDDEQAAYIAALSPDVTLALLDRITSLSKEVESLNAECATIAANTREARIVIQQVAEVVGCDWQGDVAAAVRALASPKRCTCTYEPGDSRCEKHPRCNYCGAVTERPADECSDHTKEHGHNGE